MLVKLQHKLKKVSPSNKMWSNKTSFQSPKSMNYKSATNTSPTNISAFFAENNAKRTNPTKKTYSTPQSTKNPGANIMGSEIRKMTGK